MKSHLLVLGHAGAAAHPPLSRRGCPILRNRTRLPTRTRRWSAFPLYARRRWLSVCRPQIATLPRSAAPPMSLWPRTQYRNVAAVGMRSLSIALSFWLMACSLRIERKQWLRPHIPQNQLASGLAIDKGGDEFLVAGEDRRALGDDVAAGRQQDEARGGEADLGGLRAIAFLGNAVEQGRVDGVEGSFASEKVDFPRGSACNLLDVDAAAAHGEPLGLPPLASE